MVLTLTMRLYAEGQHNGDDRGQTFRDGGDSQGDGGQQHFGHGRGPAITATTNSATQMTDGQDAQHLAQVGQTLLQRGHLVWGCAWSMAAMRPISVCMPVATATPSPRP